jgi:hypothetical protein
MMILAFQVVVNVFLQPEALLLGIKLLSREPPISFYDNTRATFTKRQAHKLIFGGNILGHNGGVGRHMDLDPRT